MIACSKLSEISNIRHGFFTRNGGVSTGEYTSLNCGPGSNDDKKNVAKNRTIVAEQLGINPENLFTMHQCHSNIVTVVDNIDAFDPMIESDALVTGKKNIALGVLTADCAPVLFSTLDGSIIAAAHAGWKGAIGGILENTISEMYELGANHNEILATIGPCISQESYEVGEEFRNNFLDENRNNHQFFRMLPITGKFLFNLPAYITDRLASLGLRSVQLIKEDTLTNESEFFSYRRSYIQGHNDYGRQISAICIN